MMLSDSLLITAFSLPAYGVLAVPPGFASRPEFGRSSVCRDLL